MSALRGSSAVALQPATALDRDALVAWARARLAALRDPDRWLALSLPAPAAPPEALLHLLARDHAFLWHPPDAAGVAGAGVAARFELAGDARVADLRRGAEALWRRLDRRDHESCAPTPPRLYGGLAFAPGAAREAPWQAFGDGSFTLPRWRYVAGRGAAGGGAAGGGAAGRGAAGGGTAGGGAAMASLTLTVRGDELGAGAEPWIDRLGRLLDGLARAAARGRVAAPPLPSVTRVARPSRRRFARQVEAIRAAIAAGGCEKIVAAQRTVVDTARPADALAALDRLSEGLRASTRFAFCRDDASFFGATPERLVSVRGEQVETEALAGSLAVGEAPPAQLLASLKDRQEHRLVVEAIVRRLAPLTERLDVAAEPRLRVLREVLHLHTPIHGRLRASRHVLDLVELLHPTPAVGGVPTEDAMRWIAAHEPEGRGWYAGPIGWFDERGDGDFAVALRTCLLRGQRAFLYAGAGIVADSDPALEYEETEVKRRTLLSALGAGR